MFAIPGLLLAMWAQWLVKSTFSKYAQVPTSRGVNGITAANWIMQHTGLNNIGVNNIAGQLTDNYDPRAKVINLSQSSVQDSVASVAVVAHELGHAEQDAQGYFPLRLRGAIVPAVQVSSWVGPLLFMAGYFLQSTGLAQIGLLAFIAGAFFAVVTLPVELDASNRAMRNLESSGLLVGDELKGARKVLNAAAMTYVAAAAQSILTVLYYVSLLTGMRRRD
ncbi:MAG TPA: zinc metallopeptidase [Thermoflexales bacterium]|nr:zinc metallopeptidase [Thermoflexales bacterium]HQW33844.1 zinc metallopeptidase [Thermoflexales bacterium]HQZ99716.1 zinc metallopeptidase [Thermoflexales bacterium]